jgi:signal transduction histidine kinase
VLEIYQDVSILKKQIAKARKKALVMTGSTMGVLFLILFLIVMKAARVINTRTRQLTDARNTLEQKVEERTLEIREAYKKLQHTQRKLIQSEKLASIGTLAAGLAHEINNPLASVASCAEGLIERLKNSSDHGKNKQSGVEASDIFPEYLKIIYNETFRCKSIISNLLNFSRQSEPKFDYININNVIQETLSIVQYQRQLKDQKMHLDLSKEPCDVLGDPQQLKQVFLNLLINALHATDTGGNISVSTHRKQTTIQIIIKDSGIGIKPEHLDKIFDPFFTTKPTGKGTGLGLAICYGIIDIHNGRIEASSEGVGRGSTFTISLPLAKQ